MLRAQVEFYKRDVELLSASAEIWGELSANSPPFTGVAGEFGDRPATASKVIWNLGSWSTAGVRDVESNTSDIVPILSEIISTPDWQSGNALSLFFTLEGRRLVSAYEAGKIQAASLRMIFIDPEGIAEQLTARPPQLFRTIGGDYGFAFRWPIDEAVATLGLSYQIEGSPNLREWSVHQPISESGGFEGIDGFRTFSPVIDQRELPETDEYFFRLRVVRAAGNPLETKGLAAIFAVEKSVAFPGELRKCYAPRRPGIFPDRGRSTSNATHSLLTAPAAMNIIQKIEKEQMKEDATPFNVGDTVKVHVRVVEGGKERIQVFAGIVIAKRGTGINEAFTVRKIASGEGVERGFPRPLAQGRQDRGHQARQSSPRASQLPARSRRQARDDGARGSLQRRRRESRQGREEESQS